MFLVVIAIVSLVTITLPLSMPVIAKRFGVRLHAAPLWLPALAAAAYIIGILLPDIHISHETNSFQEHFISGGFYTALLYLYFSKLLGWQRHWLVALIGLYAWTSSLGVLNELVEFIVTKLNLTHIDITDTSWDLLANTLGSLLCYLLYKLIERLIRSPR